MLLTLVEPTPPDIAAFGTRALSAFLKSRGKDVRVIFLPGGVDKLKHRSGFRYQYDPDVLNRLTELCRGSDLIGLSFMSSYLGRAMQLAGHLKAALGVPIIAGGVHPTVLPEPCLDFVDMVCRGEGEESLLELMERMEQGRPYDDVANLWLKRDGRIIKNPQRPPIEDLDSLPFVDFGIENHFIYDNVSRNIVPMTLELFERSLPLEPHIEGAFYDSYARRKTFKVMTTRGCPHHCSFCAESYLKKLYAGHRYLRKRGVANIIEEMRQIKARMPFVESFFAFDDTFLVRPLAEIREFAAAYKTEIGLPLHIQASPLTTTREKIEALTDAGLIFVEMGVQSLSQTGMSLYRREIKEEAILKAANVYHEFAGRLHAPCYHVILDNPWETPFDVAETLRTILNLPTPFWLKRASLVLYPGTELYEKAKAEGVLATEEDEWRLIYGKHLHMPYGSYVNFLMYLAGFSRFPRWIVRLLASDSMIRIFERKSLGPVYSRLNRLGEALIVAWKGLRSLARGDFGRIGRYVNRVMDKHR